MSTLLDPQHSSTYDPRADRIVISFRDGRAGLVVEFDPDNVPGLINGLMQARAEAKKARKPVPLPPPLVRPAAPSARPEPVPLLARADGVPVRLGLDPRRRAPAGATSP
jgi:hypothetical protein